MLNQKFKSFNRKASMSFVKADVKIDHANNPKVEEVFNKISKNNLVDSDKLQTFCHQQFGAMGESVFQVLKKHLLSNRTNIDFRVYCQQLSRFMSLDLLTIVEIFFGIVDTDRDLCLSERNVYDFYSRIEQEENSEYFMNDL